MPPNMPNSELDISLSSDKLTNYGSVVNGGQMSEDEDSKVSPLWGSYRLFVVLLGSVILCSSFASQTSMTSAMVCMVVDQQPHHHHHHRHLHDNNTHTTLTNISVVNTSYAVPTNAAITSSHDFKKTEDNDWKFSWDSQTQGWLVSCFFLGYYIMQIPSGVIVTRLGPKGCLVVGSVATGIFHLLSIPAARWSLTLLYLVRTLAGLSCGCMLPGTFALVANWCPRQETSMLFAITSNGIDLGSSFSFTLSLFGCETDFQGGWSIVFYVLGSLHLLIGASILLCITDFPSTNCYISSKESRYIADHRPHNNKANVIPVGKILRSGPVWAFIVAQFATDWIIFMVVTQGPRYLLDILRLPNWKTSMLSSFPFLTSMPFGLVIGYLSKKAVDTHIASTTSVRKATETFAKIMCAVPLAVLMFLPEGSWVSVFVIYACVAVGISGTYSGFMANPGDLSPGHAGFLTSLGQALSMWAGFVIPVFTSYITREKTRSSWQLIFTITIVIEFFSLVIYLMFGSGALQSWAECPSSGSGDEGGAQTGERHHIIDDKAGQKNKTTSKNKSKNKSTLAFLPDALLPDVQD